MGWWESPRGVVAEQLLRVWGLVRLYRAHGGADCRPEADVVALVFGSASSNLRPPTDVGGQNARLSGMAFDAAIAADVDLAIGSRRELERMLAWVWVGGARVEYQHMPLDHEGVVVDGAGELTALRWDRRPRDYRHSPDDGAPDLRSAIALTWGSEGAFWDSLAVQFGRDLLRRGYEKFAVRETLKRREAS